MEIGAGKIIVLMLVVLLVFGAKPDGSAFGMVEFTTEKPFSAKPEDWDNKGFVTDTSKPGEGVIDEVVSPDGKQLAAVVQTKSGTHIHHLVWGILLLLTTGYLGLAVDMGSPWLELTAICFGIGTFASRPYLPKASGWVALFYYAAGFTLLWVARGSEPLTGWWVGGVFGVGQLLAALVVWWNLERT